MADQAIVHCYSMYMCILLILQSDSDQVLVPRAAILTEYGRRVLPCLNIPTFG
jgi:hypothetical protein